MLRRPAVLVGAAVGAVILLIVALLVLRKGEEPAPPPPEPVLTEVPPEVDPVPAATETGYLTLVASPWAKVLAISDGAGVRQPLPAETTTPLRLELEPGVYRVALIPGDAEPPADLDSILGAWEGAADDGATPDGATPDGGTPDGGTPDGGTPDDGAPEAPEDEGDDDAESLLTTELCTVSVGESRVCNVVLAEVSARQLFLDSGWWR
jgi:hypothetical protein